MSVFGRSPAVSRTRSKPGSPASSWIGEGQAAQLDLGRHAVTSVGLDRRCLAASAKGMAAPRPADDCGPRLPALEARLGKRSRSGPSDERRASRCEGGRIRKGLAPAVIGYRSSANRGEM